MKIKMTKSLGFISLFASALAFGSFGIWIRLLSEEMSIYQQIVLRNTSALVISVIIVLATKQFSKVDWKTINIKNFLTYVILVPLAVIAYNVAMIDTKIAVATFAFYVGTILTGWAAGVFFFKEKLTTEKWVSLILVLIGLALFAYPFSSISVGLIAGIISGVLDGAANGFRKDLAGKVSKLVLVMFTAIGGVIISGGMMIVFNQDLGFMSTISNTSWGIGIFFGSLLVLLNYLLLVGFQNFDLSLGSIVLSLELLFALLFGFLFLKEFPNSREIFGGLLILLANVLPNLKDLIKKKGKAYEI